MPLSNDAGRRNVLFLTPQLPYPPQQGTALRNYNLIAQVAREHNASLLTFGDPTAATTAGPLTEICQSLQVIAPPERTQWDRVRSLLVSRLPDMALRLYSPAFQAALERLLASRRFDVLQIEGIEMALYAHRLAPLLRRLRIAVVFDDHNAEYILQRRAAATDLRIPRRWPAALYSAMQWRRLGLFEARICRLADAVVVVSAEDGRFLRRLEPALQPLVLPNGVDVSLYHQGLGDDLGMRHPCLVFTGKMDYRPNVDGMTWFHRQIWPLVQARHPESHLYVVGKGFHRALQPLVDDPTVTVTGLVPEILPYFGGADVYVAPLRMGSGTRLKLLEAMAAGLPIVSTTVGAEGLGVESGRESLLADTPEAFAGACCRLLDDTALCQQLGSAARARAESHYDWQQLVPQLNAVYRQL